MITCFMEYVQYSRVDECDMIIYNWYLLELKINGESGYNFFKHLLYTENNSLKASQ
jgi:hypothetical protein